MTDLRTAAQQALEALDAYSWEQVDAARTALRAALAEPDLFHCPKCGGPADNGHDRSIPPSPYWCTKCMAEPVQEPAQQDNETIVQTFAGLPKRKLRELLAAGWQINGVCFQRIEEDGTVRRGAATTGGMVLWWNQEQPAQQQEPVAWRYVPSDVWGDPIVTQDPRTVELARQYRRPIEPLYTAPPQRKPLTEEEIDSIWDSEKAFADIYAIARAIERAHGIGGEG